VATVAASEGERKTMSTTEGSTRPDVAPYEIRIEGHLDQRWADWLEGLTVRHESDGTTTLTGPLADQSALHGVLIRIRDLALPIVSVRRLSPDPESEIS
jgi:hypothetical protein